MNRIQQFWTQLGPKKAAGGRAHMNFIDVRTAILSARVNLKLYRNRTAQARKWGEATKRRFRLDRIGIDRFKADTARVVCSLERIMKRADRLYVRAESEEQFVVLRKQWKAHLRWMKFNLLYFKPILVDDPKRYHRWLSTL